MQTCAAIDLAIEKFGSQAAFARALGIRPPSVAEWRLRNRVPEDRCPAIECLTDGEVRCEELRPDLIWHRDATGQVIGYQRAVALALPALQESQSEPNTVKDESVRAA